MPGEDELVRLEVRTEDEYDGRAKDGEEASEDGGLKGEDSAKLFPVPRRTRKMSGRMNSRCRCTIQGDLGRRWHFANAHTWLIRSLYCRANSREYCIARSP